MTNDEFITDINHGIKLIQKKTGLRFGTDAILLAAYVKAKKTGAALEIGAGSGVVSLLCAAKNKFKKIRLEEIDGSLCEIAEKNIALNGFGKTLSVKNADCREEKRNEEYDSVFFNPPYFRLGSGKKNPDEIKKNSRHTENGDISDFCASAARALKFGGEMTAVYRPERMTDLLFAMRENAVEPKRLTAVLPAPHYPPSLILVSGKKGAGPGIFFTAPLVIKDADGNDSEDMKYIYENGDFNEYFKTP